MFIFFSIFRCDLISLHLPRQHGLKFLCVNRLDQVIIEARFLTVAGLPLVRIRLPQDDHCADECDRR